MSAVLVTGSAPSLSGALSPSPHDPWQPTRAVVVAHINAARAKQGVAPLLADELLTRVGDRHCQDLIEDRVTGHFSRRGSPPYLRYLLAGGTGYHRQNAAAVVTSAPLTLGEIPPLLLRSVDSMLAEQPPMDGHRATLLEPNATHVGIGIAAQGGWLVSTHEVIVRLTEEVILPPPVALPNSHLSYSASLPSPWQVEAVQVLWEALPTPLTSAQANFRTSYGYPPQRAIAFVHRQRPGGLWIPRDRSASGELSEGPGRRFTFRWAAGPRAGVDILVVWASRGAGQRHPVAVAAAAVVITPDGTLPTELGRWVELRGVGQQ